jgi:hypothetical protein
MKKLDYEYVLKTEHETREKTSIFLKGVKDYEPIIFDTFFQLMYFTGKQPVDDPEGDYHNFCWHQYYHAGYSLRACFILYESGYYLEAKIILRRLLEILVKMRYLQNHKEFVAPLWLNKVVTIKDIEGKKKNLSIRDMFKEIAPDLYDDFYGLLLSGFTHGGIGSGIGKISFKEPSLGAMLGSVWSEDGATFVVNTLTFIALGYLKLFPQIFADGYRSIDTDLNEKYLKSVQWLGDALADHKGRL